MDKGRGIWLGPERFRKNQAVGFQQRSREAKAPPSREEQAHGSYRGPWAESEQERRLPTRHSGNTEAGGLGGLTQVCFYFLWDGKIRNAITPNLTITLLFLFPFTFPLGCCVKLCFKISVCLGYTEGEGEGVTQP